MDYVYVGGAAALALLALIALAPRRFPVITEATDAPGPHIATQYAARHPEKASKLALIGPSPRAVDVAITAETRRELAQLRKNEPWFPAAFAALQAITEGTGSDWEAVALFAAEGAFSPKRTRAALASREAPSCCSLESSI
ncbi:hypothetical protein ACQKGL_28795 [Ensifer adhaerens]|uniref:hypothetical protein n=1 Tax=Ensifer adhaerens TaxID=106592 RepID=UPI003CFF3D6C